MPVDALSAGAVARRLGVAVTTLRTWHQRYGLGPSAHQPGQHRRYTPDDVARLETMQRLTADGVPPAEAARFVRSQPPAFGARRDGAGLALRASGPAARGLARAALRLDGLAIRHLSARIVTELGVVGAWERVFAPVLVAIGRRHAETGALVEVEHLVSRAVSEVLGAVARPAQGSSTRILLACTDEEQHSLPLEALAAALAERGVPSRLLGARVPPNALEAALARTGPSAVLLWAHQHATANVEQVHAACAARASLVAVGGPGWSGADLPPGVATPASLSEAVDLLSPIDASSRQG